MAGDPQCGILPDGYGDDEWRRFQQGHHRVIEAIAFELQVVGAGGGLMLRDFAFVEPVVHPQTKACLLGKYQQKEEGYYLWILSKHWLQSYLKCNNISKTAELNYRSSNRAF